MVIIMDVEEAREHKRPEYVFRMISQEERRRGDVIAFFNFSLGGPCESPEIRARLTVTPYPWQVRRYLENADRIEVSEAVGSGARKSMEDYAQTMGKEFAVVRRDRYGGEHAA